MEELMRRSIVLALLISTIFSTSVTACATTQPNEMDQRNLVLEDAEWWITWAKACTKVMQRHAEEQDPTIKEDLIRLADAYLKLADIRKRDLESIMNSEPYKEDYMETLREIQAVEARLEARGR